MSRSLSLQKIEQIIFQSAITAADCYEQVSGGYWLSHATESYIQSKIFDGLANVKPIFVTLESSPKKISFDFDVMRDRRSDKMKAAQRFDILAWYANGQPRLIIEVKKIFQRNFTGALRDIKRMRPWIEKNQPNIQRGYMMVYTEARGKDSAKKIIERTDEFALESSTKKVRLDIIRDEESLKSSCALSLFAVIPRR